MLKIITRNISNFKLWTAIRLRKILYAKYLKPRKIKLIFMSYFLLSLLLNFLPSRPLLYGNETYRKPYEPY
jgi:hypothetical protein